MLHVCNISELDLKFITTNTEVQRIMPPPPLVSIYRNSSFFLERRQKIPGEAENRLQITDYLLLQQTAQKKIMFKILNILHAGRGVGSTNFMKRGEIYPIGYYYKVTRVGKNI